MKCTIPEISWHNREPVLSVDIQINDSKDCKFYRLATGGSDSHVLIWQLKVLENGSAAIELLSDLTRHQRAVNVVRWSPNGQFLASADDDANIILWTLKTDNIPSLDGETNDKETWISHKTLRGHKEDIYDLCWSPDGTKLLSGSIDNTAIIWNVAKGKSEQIMTDHKSFVQGVAWDPKQEYLATLSSDRICRIFDSTGKHVKSRICRGVLPLPADHALHNKEVKYFHDDTFKTYFRRLNFTPDGNMLVVPSGCVETDECKKALYATYLFTLNSLTTPVAILHSPRQCTIVAKCSPVLYTLRVNSAHVTPYVILPYRMIIAVATDSDVILYDTQQLQPFAHLQRIHYTRLTDLTWSSDGLVLTAASTDGFCTLVTFDRGELGEVYVAPPVVEVKEEKECVKECEEVKENKESKEVKVTEVKGVKEMKGALKKISLCIDEVEKEKKGGKVEKMEIERAVEVVVEQKRKKPSFLEQWTQKSAKKQKICEESSGEKGRERKENKDGKDKDCVVVIVEDEEEEKKLPRDKIEAKTVVSRRIKPVLVQSGNPASTSVKKTIDNDSVKDKNSVNKITESIGTDKSNLSELKDGQETDLGNLCNKLNEILTEKIDKSEQIDKSVKNDQPDKTDNTDKTDKFDKTDNTDKSDQINKQNKIEQTKDVKETTKTTRRIVPTLLTITSKTIENPVEKVLLPTTKVPIATKVSRRITPTLISSSKTGEIIANNKFIEIDCSNDSTESTNSVKIAEKFAHKEVEVIDLTASSKKSSKKSLFPSISPDKKATRKSQFDSSSSSSAKKFKSDNKKAEVESKSSTSSSGKKLRTSTLLNFIQRKETPKKSPRKELNDKISPKEGLKPLVIEDARDAWKCQENSPEIDKIDKSSGKVTAVYDLTEDIPDDFKLEVEESRNSYINSDETAITKDVLSVKEKSDDESKKVCEIEKNLQASDDKTIKDTLVNKIKTTNKQDTLQIKNDSTKETNCSTAMEVVENLNETDKDKKESNTTSIVETNEKSTNIEESSPSEKENSEDKLIKSDEVLPRMITKTARRIPLITLSSPKNKKKSTSDS